MTTIESFIFRLKTIGIEIELFANYPWVYIDRVNGKKVEEKFMANHGFTAFFLTKEGAKITDVTTIFRKIRELMNDEKIPDYIMEQIRQKVTKIEPCRGHDAEYDELIDDVQKLGPADAADYRQDLIRLQLRISMYILSLTGEEKFKCYEHFKDLI